MDPAGAVHRTCAWAGDAMGAGGEGSSDVTPQRCHTFGARRDWSTGVRPPKSGIVRGMANNLLKRLLDAGVTFGEVTQTKADEIFTILRDSGVKRKEAEKTVLELADQARQQTDKFVARIKSELADQIVSVADRLDSLEDKIEDLAERAAGVVNPPKAPATKAPAANATTTKAPSKKAPAKKATAKKATAKKATSKKATTKKAAVKKTGAKKKTVAKKAAAKKKG